MTFDIDANGILTAGAKDKTTNKSQSIKIEGSIGLSKEEIEKMKKEAEMHAGQDQKKRELSEVKNLADNLIYTADKALRETGDKISPDMKKEIEEKTNELKKTRDGDNTEDIKQKTQDLSQAIQKIGAEMYKKGDGNPPAGGPSEGKEPKAEEGEYKEK